MVEILAAPLGQRSPLNTYLHDICLVSQGH